MWAFIAGQVVFNICILMAMRANWQTHEAAHKWMKLHGESITNLYDRIGEAFGLIGDVARLKTK